MKIALWKFLGSFLNIAFPALAEAWAFVFRALNSKRPNLTGTWLLYVWKARSGNTASIPVYCLFVLFLEIHVWAEDLEKLSAINIVFRRSFTIQEA